MTARLSRAPPLDPASDRWRGAWLGLVVGDALGAPWEFKSAQEISRRCGRVTEMKAGGLWQAGEWTDDTALAIATARAYAGDCFDLGAAAQAMLAWLASGPKDVGSQTRAALVALRDGRATPETAGRLLLEAKPGAAGNGSLMRAAPTGLVRRIDDPRLRDESVALSSITHADPRCTAACVAFNAALSAMVHDGGGVSGALAAARRAAAGLDAGVTAILDAVSARAPQMHGGDPIGYVLLCLERALIALRDSTSFEEGLIEVVCLGGDADTNAAVAGALLGARFGEAAIPCRWLDALLRRAEVDEALAQLAGYR